MSKILIIRHLPTTLSFQDKEQLMKHFGAEKVWETSSKRNYIFASFNSIEKAKASLSRLHQLEIAKRRLVVEYSFEKEPVSHGKEESAETSTTTKLVKEFLKLINGFNPSVDFYQPPPVHLKYKYPEPTPEIIINIIYALFVHKPFYTQILHLMNKMCLKSPFADNIEALQFFKEQFRRFFLDVQPIPLPPEETESELSEEETEQTVQTVSTLVKRKRKLPALSRKRGIIPVQPPVTKVKKINQEEVFETVNPIVEPKKISLVVTQDALQKTVEAPQVVGELGKFEKEEQRVVEEVDKQEVDQPTITKKELLQNRISYSDMKVLSVFKHYHPGQPSMRLYIKNLAKTVTEQDVKRIYKRYIEKLSEEEQNGFDVRVMQEGRMKGQGFVTFPTIRIAETALNETNGYLLKEKPMVVQFARVANKNTVD